LSRIRFVLELAHETTFSNACIAAEEKNSSLSRSRTVQSLEE